MNHHPSNTERMDELYRKLTGVKINEQLKSWDARGKGYYGEYLIFSELYNNIPGNCKILMNIEIPSVGGKTTEIDLLLIHETGLYVFEAKHYKGSIKGKIDEQRWTQYFRTSDNHSFNNPILQNRWHIEQLRKLFPLLPIQSFIVFTNPECELHITGQDENTVLCHRRTMCSNLKRVAQNAPVCMTMEHIDAVFTSLKPYSPMQEIPVSDQDDSFNLYDLVAKITELHSEKARQLEDSFQNKEKDLQEGYHNKEKAVDGKLKKARFLAASTCSLVLLLAILLISSTTSSYKSKAEAAIADADAKVAQYQTEADAAKKELTDFAKKWSYITDFEVDGAKLNENFVSVSNVTLTDSVDFGNTVKLSGTLTHNGEDYYVLFDKSSTFTIVLKNGQVIETPVYKSQYSSYSLGFSNNAKKLDIKNVEFSGFAADAVSFIKITNLQVKRIKAAYNEKAALSDYELVLYTAQ